MSIGERRVFLFPRRSSKFRVGTGNGRQYKQTVSFGEFRDRLYRRSGATACTATLLDLERSSVYWCDEDTRLQAYTWLRIAHTLFLTVSPSHMHTKATIYWRPLRYLSVECHTPSFHSSPPSLSTFLHAPSSWRA